MTRLATLFTCSFRRLKEVRTVTVCAMLGAIAIVLGSLSIDLGPSVRIGFSGIPNELVHYLFGPAAGSLFAGALDILIYDQACGRIFPRFYPCGDAGRCDLRFFLLQKALKSGASICRSPCCEPGL